jgi:hypothetical protein
MIGPPAGLERIVQLSKGDGVVNSSLMEMPRKQSADAHQSALRADRENENRWVRPASQPRQAVADPSNK